MSVFDNDTSKGYSDRNPTGPSQQDINPQNYRLAKISKAEAYFLGKMTKREKLAKLKFKCCWHWINSCNPYSWQPLYSCMSQLLGNSQKMRKRYTSFSKVFRKTNIPFSFDKH